MEIQSELRTLDLSIEKLKELRKQIVKTDKALSKWMNKGDSSAKAYELENMRLDRIRKETWNEIFSYQQHLKFPSEEEHFRIDVDNEDLELEAICYGLHRLSKVTYPKDIEDKIINVIKKNIKRGHPPRVGECLYISNWIFYVSGVTYYDDDYNIYYSLIEHQEKRAMYEEDLAQRFPEIRKIYNIPRHDPNDIYKNKD